MEPCLVKSNLQIMCSIFNNVKIIIIHFFKIRIGISPTEVAVISFYNRQSELIKRMFDDRIQNGAVRLLGVEIRNVDGYQVETS